MHFFPIPRAGSWAGLPALVPFGFVDRLGSWSTLARHLAENVLKFEAVHQSASRNASNEAKTTEASREVDSMSEDELVALLSKELDKSEGSADTAGGRRR